MGQLVHVQAVCFAACCIACTRILRLHTLLLAVSRRSQATENCIRPSPFADRVEALLLDNNTHILQSHNVIIFISLAPRHLHFAPRRACAIGCWVKHCMGRGGVAEALHFAVSRASAPRRRRRRHVHARTRYCRSCLPVLGGGRPLLQLLMLTAWVGGVPFLRNPMHMPSFCTDAQRWLEGM